MFSATSLKTFLRCPKQWYFSHVEKLKSPPSIKMKLGIAAHSAVEHNFKQKLVSRVDEPEADVLDAFSEHYDREIEEVEKPDEDPGKAKDDGVKIMRLHHRQIAPDVQPLWVEKQSTFRVISEHREECDKGAGCSCGVPFSVTVDAIDEARQVRDLKTTARRPSQGQHLMQLAAGAIGFEAETGEKATDLVVDYLIRTKVPATHVERWGGPLDAHMRRTFATQVNTAASMAAQGMFPATGVEAGPGGPCSWCGFGPRGANICPVWRKNPRTGGAK